VNANSEGKRISIALDGVTKVAPKALLVTLSGKTRNATNTITDPRAVVPVKHAVAIAGPKFDHTFAPYSVNVLELNY